MKLDLETVLTAALVLPVVAFFSYHSLEVVVFVAIPSLVMAVITYYDNN
jgi:hypothetical protein